MDGETLKLLIFEDLRKVFNCIPQNTPLMLLSCSTCLKQNTNNDESLSTWPINYRFMNSPFSAVKQ